mmetsp:Transcript_9727/g.34524  ORF Transcript_9727/g.34524 Transcript_9727/m.34524 type:complete len:221 (-) Transcript_9727:171-833(-)
MALNRTLFAALLLGAGAAAAAADCRDGECAAAPDREEGSLLQVVKRANSSSQASANASANASWNPFSSSSSTDASMPWGECDGMGKGWNHCIVSSLVCVTGCGRTHVTLDGVCTAGGQGISDDGSCPTTFTCPLDVETIMSMQEISSLIKSTGTSVLKSNGVKFYAYNGMGCSSVNIAAELAGKSSPTSAKSPSPSPSSSSSSWGSLGSSPSPSPSPFFR